MKKLGNFLFDVFMLAAFAALLVYTAKGCL